MCCTGVSWSNPLIVPSATLLNGEHVPHNAVRIAVQFDLDVFVQTVGLLYGNVPTFLTAHSQLAAPT